MLRASLFGLGVATLCVTAVAIDGAGGIEALPAPEPRPAFLALGGGLVELAAAGHGPGCFAPMLDELRRHPNWSVRIDDLVWGDVVSDDPDERRAAILIDGQTATWRDGALAQNLALTESERRAVLAAFALDCRVDDSLPSTGYTGRYIGIALGEGSAPVTQFPTNSPIAVRLQALFDAIRARYVVSRADDLNGFSIELAGTRRDYDDRNRPIRVPHQVEFRDQLAGSMDLERRVRLLDWAMTQPVTLPASDRVARGTLRAYGTSRPIAIDLGTLEYNGAHWAFNELQLWATIERQYNADADAAR
jgi:hypothetical protein